MEKTGTWTWPDRYLGKEFNIVEERSRNEWYQQFRSDIQCEMNNYIELIALLKDSSVFFRVRKSFNYQDFVAGFNIDTFFRYDCNNPKRADILLEEILLKALNYFPDEKNITNRQDSFPFLLILVRIYNAQGRFKEAQKLLQENNLDLYSKNRVEFLSPLPNAYQQIAFYESCICKMAITKNYQLWKESTFYPFTLEKLEKLIELQDTLTYDIRPYLGLPLNNIKLKPISKELNKEDEQQTTRDYIVRSLITQIKYLDYLYGR